MTHRWRFALVLVPLLLGPGARRGRAGAGRRQPAARPVALVDVPQRRHRGQSRDGGFARRLGDHLDDLARLFGTVWGVMDSFVGISQAHTSNLAVVAPGIAEALLATAVGLVAAIPAVVIFNGFARAVAGYRALLGDAAAEVMRHLSRDLDRRPMLRQQAAE